MQVLFVNFFDFVESNKFGSLIWENLSNFI